MRGKFKKTDKNPYRKMKFIIFLSIITVFAFIPASFAAEDGSTSDVLSEGTAAGETAESEYPSRLHLAYQTDESSPYGKGNTLYHSLKITGSAMPEEEIFNVSELERISVGLEQELFKEISTDGSGTYQGLDFLRFAGMCGLDSSADDSTVFSFYEKGKLLPSLTCTLKELKECEPLIAFSRNGVPLVINSESDGYQPENENTGGPVLFYAGDGKSVSCLAKVLISDPEDLADPCYGLHIREPLLYMQDTVFTVNYIDRNAYPDPEVSAEAFRSCSFTMKEIEDLMTEVPEQVRGSYFGISGNEKTKYTFGLGGFCDYYEGLDLCWLVREKTGLQKGDGYAVFYGRDLDAYGTVQSLDYFFANKQYRDYYLEIDNETMITDVAPILAVSKNGYPLLPEHNHDLEGHVSYNLFNHNAEALGFESKIGIVKNVSGPFAAGLADLDGVYGGYRCETNGDCIRIDFYVDPSDYEEEEQTSFFRDVPEESWFYEDVKYLTGQGILNGMTEDFFVPEGNVTRAQLVKMAAVWAGAETNESPDSGFADVPSDHWASAYIRWAADAGIINGTGDGNFCPEQPVSREQMAAILDRLIKNLGISIYKTEEKRNYSDQDLISDYALPHIENLSEYGIMSGKEEGRFDPLSNTSRAEASAVIARLARRSI